jgi:glycosyltransferase involved in cell wall biosynthesis
MSKINKKLVVAVIVKDNASSVGRVFRKLERLRGRFGDLAYVVYENNSTDGTKEILRALSRELPSFTLLSEDLSPERQAAIATARHRDGRPCRIELIAAAREKAHTALAREYSGFDFVLVLDVDVAWFSLRGILRNALRLEGGGYDCIAANGVTKWLRYRDAFALRSPSHPFGPELLGEYWWEVIKHKIQRRLGGRRLESVYSAFGGAALYSMEAFRAGKYGALPDSAYMEVQKSLDISTSSPEERGRVSVAPIPNTNYSRPVVCEHVPFCYSMRRAGFGRIAVDPAWRILFLD